MLLSYLIRAMNKNVCILFLALFFGAIGALAFPPYNYTILGLVSYGSLFLLIHKSTSLKETALYSFLWGTGFHVSGLWWIAQALLVEGNPYKWAYPLAVLGLPILLSLFYVCFCIFYKKIIFQKKIPLLLSALLFALFFSLFEWMRGVIFTGFPWNLPAYIWSQQIEILQSLSFLGAYGLSALTLLFSIILSTLIIDHSKTSITGAFLILTLFSCFYVWGDNRLQNAPPYTPPEGLMIRIIQPNISQVEKWNPNYYTKHLNTLMSLSISDIPDNGDTKAFLIFPETALNDVMMSTAKAKEVFQKISEAYKAKGKDVFILTGALRTHVLNDTQKEYYNSALLYNSEGYIIDDYNKSHLVPFGEYMPLSNIIDISPIVQFTGFTAGEGVKTIYHKDLPSFGVALCYEIIFPHKLIDQNDRPDILITLTNDAWYGQTPGPYQHYMMARYRAIEEHLPVLRSANTGVSGAFDSYGREIKSLPLDKRGFIDLY